MDREAWHAAIRGVAKSRTWLSDWTELNWTERLLECMINLSWKYVNLEILNQLIIDIITRKCLIM